MTLLRRQQNLTVRSLLDGNLLVHGQLNDEGHLMDVQLVVDGGGRVLSAYATVGQAPSPAFCQPAVAQVRGVVGLAIDHDGALTEILQRVGQDGGSPDLAALTVSAAQACLTARQDQHRRREDGPEEGDPSPVHPEGRAGED